MKTSKEVILYLKKNLDIHNLLTVFYAGSIPNELTSESDLDIFIVMKKGKEDRFLNNLTRTMNKFIEKDNSVTYSFFRGPLKYKNKGLIHFIIYTEEHMPTTSFGDAFKDEIREVLKTLAQSAKVIKGKNPKAILKKIDLNVASKKGHDITKLKNKYKIFQEKNYIKYREWKKTKAGWRFNPTKKYASKFFRTYLMHYFKKNGIA